jgi:hypothetical protein
MASITSTWSLEAYIQIHQALTKGGSTVQPVNAYEECFYKNTDLKQVGGPQLVGYAASREIAPVKTPAFDCTLFACRCCNCMESLAIGFSARTSCKH